MIETNLVNLLQDARWSDVREMFAPQLRPLVTVESLRAAWEAEIQRHGALVAVGTPISEPAGRDDMTLLRVPVAFAHGAVTVLATVAGDTWLTSLQIAGADAAQPMQPWQPPAYADPAALVEEEVTVGEGPLAVPGVLTRPATPGPHPAVVMLSGSGPNDRDETIGRNKPFKDIAWGLATRGVATVRFDKITYARRDQVVADPDFTVEHEYVVPALAAVDLLRQRSDRVFVLGHSQGGTLAPRVAAAAPAVAGLVILAGGAQPMQWAAVRQLHYLASLDPATAAASGRLLETITRQARTVDSPDLSASTPASDLPFGVPATYWLDLRGYDPAAEAAKIDRPILLLQGARDYQATVADDLARWQALLAGRADVTVRVYQADDHLFFGGEGPSTPAGYEPAQHVDPAVVADIAEWIAGLEQQSPN